VTETISQEEERLIAAGHNVFKRWGGGKSPQGVQAYVDCIEEIFSQISFTPDYIFAPVGTGTTFCGLSLGAKQIFPNCKTIGISVAREKKIATEPINDIVRDWNDHYGKDVQLLDLSARIYD